MHQRAMTILWPSFAMAGALEGLVFFLVDPADLHVGHFAVDASPQAIYTLAFLAFWGVIATSGAVTALLNVDPEAVDPPRPGA